MQALMVSIAEYGQAAMIAILSLLGLLASRYVLVLIKQATIRGVLERAGMEIRDAILEVSQTYADALREGNADGKLTAEERGEAKRRAIEIAKSNLGRKGLTRISRVLGIESAEQWIASKVESVIAASKSPKAPTLKSPDPT